MSEKQTNIQWGEEKEVEREMAGRLRERERVCCVRNCLPQPRGPSPMSDSAYDRRGVFALWLQDVVRSYNALTLTNTKNIIHKRSDVTDRSSSTRCYLLTRI